MTLSEPGLLGAWNILVKGTLGVLTSLTLAATTPLRELLLGLQRLHAPAMIVTIATLMLRYVDVIAGEAARMRQARISRGHDPRFLWQAGATARGVGSLFVRSYERGERVHLAMLSRGWAGEMPRCPTPSPPGGSGPSAGSGRGGGGPGRDRMAIAPPEPAAPTLPPHRRRRCRSPGWPTPTRTDTRRCTAST